MVGTLFFCLQKSAGKVREFEGVFPGNPHETHQKVLSAKETPHANIRHTEENPFMPHKDFRPGYAKQDTNRRNQWNRQYCIITNIS